MRDYILDANNNPVKSEDAWAWLKENPYRKVVSLTRFPKGPRVSTVFLSMDHGYGGGIPVLWETMVFDTESNDEFNDYQERYTSHNEAVAGHLSVVKAILNRPENGQKGTNGEI